MGAELRRLGKLEFMAFPIAFGGGAISGEGGGYGFGHITEQESLALLNRALELGINVFDSAPIYGYGVSEKRMGLAFAKKRDKVFLVTKGGVTWHENKRVDMTNSPAVIERMLEESLLNMNTDYIDLYMIHWPDSQVDIRKPLEILKKAKDQGKIRAIGLCNTTLEDLKKGQEVVSIDVVQSEFNLFRRKIVDELFPFLTKKKIGFMSWGTLDKGILSGRVKSDDRKYDKDDARSWAPWWKNEDRTSKYKAMEEIRLMLCDKGFSELQLALSFNLHFSEVSTALCGYRSLLQLEEVVDALEGLPGADILDQALSIVKKYHVE